MSAPVTVVTWNLQGSAGVDVPGVAGVIAAARPDVVAVQEIQWGQARRLGRALGMAHRWAFKHFPLRDWPEGLAVFTPHELAATSKFVLRREWWWSWQRRIAIVAVIRRGAEQFGVINVHLSPHDEGAQRVREAGLVLRRARRVIPGRVIAGDCNEQPDGAAYAAITAAGWRDAWMLDHLADVDGATNWTAGDRLGRQPTQRLDYVFAPPEWTVVDATLLAPVDQLDWFAERSDHLPLAATLMPPDEHDSE